MKHYREDFPVLEKYTYLNTSSSGMIPKPVYEFRKGLDEAFYTNGSIFRDEYIDDIQGVKETVGKIFNCPVNRVGLVTNFSIAANGVAEALQHKKNVLFLKGEYPSVTEPFKSRGYTLTEILRNDLSYAHFANAIEQYKIDILLISDVQWNNGDKVDNQTLLSLKHSFPDLLIIGDGTQSLGTYLFDFDVSGYDIMAASAYKWLSAGYGNGFVLMSQQLEKEMDLKLAGNNTLMFRLLSGHTNYGQRWEPGHLDTLNFLTLQKSLEYLTKVGFGEIEKKIQKLSLHLKTGLVRAGYLPPQVLAGTTHTGIINIPGNAAIVEKLKQDNIIISYRDGLRLGIHFYNEKEDIDKFLNAMKILVG